VKPSMDNRAVLHDKLIFLSMKNYQQDYARGWRLRGGSRTDFIQRLQTAERYIGRTDSSSPSFPRPTEADQPGL
jgi:hypothetical protein